MTELERYRHIGYTMTNLDSCRDALAGAGMANPTTGQQMLAALLVDVEELRREIVELERDTDYKLDWFIANHIETAAEEIPQDIRDRLQKKVLEPLRFEHGRLQYAVENGDAIPAYTVKPIEEDVRKAIAELRAIIGDTDNRPSWDEEVRNND